MAEGEETDTTTYESLPQQYIEATDAILAGRDSYDSHTGIHPYGGAWKGPIFVLTHHPEDARQDEGFTRWQSHARRRSPIPR